MNHLKQIAARLPEYGVDAMLLTSEPGEFYAVGFHGEGVVVVTAGECFYFTDSRYIEAANHLITGASISMTDRSRNYRAMVQEVVDRCGVKRMGFEEEYLSVASYQIWKEGVTPELVPAQKLVNGLRAAKDQEEIELMVKAQEITDRAFREILTFIQPGMTEQEIAAKLQYDMLRFGAMRMSFDPIVASGPNGSRPHAIPGPRKIQRGEFVTMDFGCVYGGYCSDMTRTFYFKEVSDEHRHIYETVRKANEAAIAKIKPGIPLCELDNTARQLITDEGYGPQFNHRLGHFIGLSEHEFGDVSSVNTDKAVPGMIFSIEPGIYLTDDTGVRVEDLVLVTEDGCEVLNHYPKELQIIG